MIPNIKQERVVSLVLGCHNQRRFGAMRGVRGQQAVSRRGFGDLSPCGSADPSLFSPRKLHSGMKTYGCELCGKRFLDSLRLRMHLLAHSGGLRMQGRGAGGCGEDAPHAHPGVLQPPSSCVSSGGDTRRAAVPSQGGTLQACSLVPSNLIY